MARPELGTRPAAPLGVLVDEALAPLVLRDAVEPLRVMLEPPVEVAALDELLVVGMIEAMPLAIDEALTQFDDEGVE